MDGRLEVRLFSVNHHPHILLLRILEDLVQSVHLMFSQGYVLRSLLTLFTMFAFVWNISA